MKKLGFVKVEVKEKVLKCIHVGYIGRVWGVLVVTFGVDRRMNTNVGGYKMRWRRDVKDIKTRGGSFLASKKERELERLQCLVSDFSRVVEARILPFGWCCELLRVFPLFFTFLLFIFFPNFFFGWHPLGTLTVWNFVNYYLPGKQSF